MQGGQAGKSSSKPPEGKKRKLLSKAAGTAALQKMKERAGGVHAAPAAGDGAAEQPERVAQAGVRSAGHRTAGRPGSKTSAQHASKANPLPLSCAARPVSTQIMASGVVGMTWLRQQSWRCIFL